MKFSSFVILNIKFHLDPDSQRRSSVDNQSERTTFSAKLRDISPTKQRFQNLPKPSDLKRAIKQSSTKGGVDIDMDYLLKFPIEIWVSSGEPFVKPAGLFKSDFCISIRSIVSFRC